MRPSFCPPTLTEAIPHNFVLTVTSYSAKETSVSSQGVRQTLIVRIYKNIQYSMSVYDRLVCYMLQVAFAQTQKLTDMQADKQTTGHGELNLNEKNSPTRTNRRTNRQTGTRARAHSLPAATLAELTAAAATNTTNANVLSIPLAP